MTNYNYYELPREERHKIRMRIARRAYEELPDREYTAENGDVVVNCGYGIPMNIVAVMGENQRDDILLQGESCVIGMNGYYEKGDPDIDLRHMDPAGNPIKVHERGSKQLSVADSFAFINSGKLYATFLGGYQISSKGDLASWAVSDDHYAGMGGAGALVRGAQRVICCIIEYDKEGNRKLVDECTLPLTGRGCVDLVITDLGVYKIEDGEFKQIEKYNEETGQYEKVS